VSSSGVIVGVGMSTPLGLDARQSALVFRARKLNPEKTEFRDRRGFAIGDVRARRLDDALVGRDRMLDLAAPALAEAVRGLDPAEPLPLFLAVPERRAEAEKPLGPDFLTELSRRSKARLALDRSEAFPAGHAAFAVALSRALASVAARAHEGGRDRRPYAIVGGVDSHHDPAVLSALDEERRLHGEGAWDGFIPSEAAAFVVIGPPGSAPAFARITSVATGAEREEDPENPSIGEAATEVVRAAAAGFREHVPWVLCDVNGERHRVKEWSFVRIRNRDRFDEAKTIETRPYEELGDVGAASGAVFAAYASMAFRLGFAPAPRALVNLRSEGPARGAFVLEAP